MSNLWVMATQERPWSHESDDEDLDNGVEEYGDMDVAHPDDTPYHDDELMDTARITHEKINPHDSDLQGLQGWLSKSTLDHFADHPDEITHGHEPVSIIHDEDTGERFVADGHHRIVVARHLGHPSAIPARISHVSRDRL